MDIEALSPWIGVWLVCGLIASGIGTSKGLAGGGWFFAGLLLGPLGVVFAMMASRTPQVEAERQRAIDAELGRTPPTSVDELAKLAEMHDAGVLSDDEFEAAKRKALGL
jgi:hypothetical protein